MATANAKFVTAEELLAMSEDKCRYELVRGVLIRKPFLGHMHRFYAANVGAELGYYVDANSLGRTYSASCGFMLATNPDTVLAPNASFVCQERFDAVGDTDGYFPSAPDLAVEILSPDDRLTDVYDKVEEWLNAGTLMVVVVNPRDRTASVHTTDSVVTLSEDDTLDGGDVVPGWRLPIADIFE